MNLRKKKDFELNKFITKILFFSSFLSVHPNIAEFCRLKEPDGDGVPIVFVVVFVLLLFLFFGFSATFSTSETRAEKPRNSVRIVAAVFDVVGVGVGVVVVVVAVVIEV